MYNRMAMRDIERINSQFASGEINESDHIKAIKDLSVKYAVEIKFASTLPNGISLYQLLDPNGKIVAEWHDTAKNLGNMWGGSRPASVAHSSATPPPPGPARSDSRTRNWRRSRSF